MNLYGLFILDVNIKYIVFSILCREINVPMACKELTLCTNPLEHICLFYSGYFCIRLCGRVFKVLTQLFHWDLSKNSMTATRRE